MDVDDEMEIEMEIAAEHSCEPEPPEDMPPAYVLKQSQSEDILCMSSPETSLVASLTPSRCASPTPPCPTPPHLQPTKASPIDLICNLFGTGDDDEDWTIDELYEKGRRGQRL